MKKEKTFKAKVPGLFKKSYTDKQYRKKILAKLFVPADKKFVESLFSTAKDPKKGDTRWTLDASLIRDKASMKRVARIAKEIKRQKGRVNIGSVVAALACAAFLVLVLVVFRNQIARFAVVSSMEGAFGAKCDVRDIDVNLLDAHFEIEGLAQANRKEPMTNLFEVGRIDIHFNLLELTRAKFIAENVEIIGVSWKTSRASDGSLPPKAEKKFVAKQKKAEKDAKPNPVQEKVSAELSKIKEGVSVGSGIAAVKDQLDPAKYIEREKSALLSPGVVAEIQSTVPALSSKWKASADDARVRADAALADAKKVAAIKVDSLKTPAEIKSALDSVNAASSTVKSALESAGGLSKDLAKDSETVSALSSWAEKAIASDAKRLKDLAASVKSVNLDSGSRVVSGLFDSFIMNSLGSYYPLYQKGLATLSAAQSSGKDSKAAKEASLKKKSGAVSRAVGRDIPFGADPLPRVLVRNLALSASDAAGSLSGSAGAENITDDQDKLGAPTSFDAKFAHGTASESVSGTLDFRASAAERANAAFEAKGYPVSFASSGSGGVPSLDGTLGAKGTFVASADGALAIGAAVRVDGARLAVPAFEPAYLHSLYADVLSEISSVDLLVKITIAPDGSVNVDASSDIDKEVSAALARQLGKQVERVKAELRAYGDSWLADQKKAYSSEIARFGEVSAKAKAAVDDLKKSEKTIADKKAALEAKAREQTDAAASAAKAAADKAVAPAAKAAGDKIKKLF